MSAAAIRRKWAGKEERRSTGCTYLIGLLGGVEPIRKKGSLDAALDHSRRLLLFVAFQPIDRPKSNTHG